jgi:hypothetical protein
MLANHRVQSQIEFMETVPEQPSMRIHSQARDKDGSSERAGIFLISLLYQTMNAADANVPFFTPMLKAAISKNAELDFFSLYALRVYCINKQYRVQPILSAINHIFKDTIGEESTFTLLNLLYQLLSLPRMNIEEKHMPWFQKWVKNLRALLVCQLTSPFAEVRDLVLLVMQCVEGVCADYGEAVTITSILGSFKKRISRCRPIGISDPLHLLHRRVPPSPHAP